MLVLQQIKVLPKGAKIYIYDGNETVSSFKKSIEDGSLLFDSIETSERYYKIYSTFKVYELSVQLHTYKVLNLDLYSAEQKEIVYCIQIRGESDAG